MLLCLQIVLKLDKVPAFCIFGKLRVCLHSGVDKVGCSVCSFLSFCSIELSVFYA